MPNEADHDPAALFAQLTTALALADRLEFTIVAIHIDEALAAFGAYQEVGVVDDMIPDVRQPG